MTTTVHEKDPDRDATYEIDVFEAFVTEALRSHEFALGNITRAQRDTGFYLECTQAGRTGHNYPHAWPRRAGEAVLDGSVEWTARHPADVTPPTIQSVSWAASVPSGLTLASQEKDDHAARATFSGGIAGTDYEVTATITPTVGQPQDVTITIPVREQ